MTEKIYHIYFKEKCIYHSLTESQFKDTWDMIRKFLMISDCAKLDDLNYEELNISKETVLNGSY